MIEHPYETIKSGFKLIISDTYLSSLIITERNNPTEFSLSIVKFFLLYLGEFS